MRELFDEVHGILKGLPYLEIKHIDHIPPYKDEDHKTKRFHTNQALNVPENFIRGPYFPKEYTIDNILKKLKGLEDVKIDLNQWPHNGNKEFIRISRTNGKPIDKELSEYPYSLVNGGDVTFIFMENRRGKYKNS